MRPEEELIQLRQEKIIWQAEKAALQEENAELRAKLAEVSEALTRVTHRLEALEEQQAKDSHNSHLPPSSDRFHRQPKSLRRKSGKEPGGQPDHPGQTMMLSPTPDLVLVHPIEHCQHCQQDLRTVVCLQVERRQVIDLPPKRIVVIEHQAQQKCCPACQQISTAAFPDN